jgi:hypothetical protein
VVGEERYHDAHRCTLRENAYYRAGTIVNLKAGKSYFSRVKIEVRSGGTLNATGTLAKPLVFRADAASPKDNDWSGLGVLCGGTIVVKYCEVQDAEWGVFVNSPSEATLPSLNVVNTVFINCHTGIVTFSGIANIPNVTFDGCNYGYWDYCERENVLSDCDF